jgi:hypothetical protein
MEEIIMNPAIIAPSQAPSSKRTVKRPAKFRQAAWQTRTIPQIVAFKLENITKHDSLTKEFTIPQPLSDWKPLQGEILRIFEYEVRQIEYGT